MGGCGRSEVGVFLLYGGSVSATLWIGDVGDVSTHTEDSGKLSSLGDTMLDWVIDKEAGGW